LALFAPAFQCRFRSLKLLHLSVKLGEFEAAVLIKIDQRGSSPGNLGKAGLNAFQILFQQTDLLARLAELVHDHLGGNKKIFHRIPDRLLRIVGPHKGH
jgi:hypothetical protein